MKSGLRNAEKGICRESNFKIFPEGHAPGPPEVPAFGSHACALGAHVKMLPRTLYILYIDKIFFCIKSEHFS